MEHYENINIKTSFTAINLPDSNLNKKKKNYKFETILKVYIQMKKKTIIKFGDTEIKNHKFHQYSKTISIENIDIDKIVVSNKVSFGKNGFRYFIGYKDAEN